MKKFWRKLLLSFWNGIERRQIHSKKLALLKPENLKKWNSIRIEKKPNASLQFHFDGNKCTDCRECEKVCPTNVIQIRSMNFDEVQRPWIEGFKIDMKNCLQCGLCVERCEPIALTFGMLKAPYGKRSELVLEFGQGKVSQTQMEEWKKYREMEWF